MAAETESQLSVNDGQRGNGLLRSLGLLIVILGGVWAMTQPTNQNITFMNRRLEKVENRMGQYDHLEQQQQSRFSSLEEKFKEIKTRIEFVQERNLEFKEWLDWWQQTVPAVDAMQNTQVVHLKEDIARIQVKLDQLIIESAECLQKLKLLKGTN